MKNIYTPFSYLRKIGLAARDFLSAVVIPFAKVHHDTILLIALPVTAFLVAWVALLLISQISLYNFFWLLLYYTSFLAIGYWIIPERFRKEINGHPIYFSLLAILVPILIGVGTQLADRSSKFWIDEISIKEENNRNYSHLRSIIDDLKHDPATIFWRDFSISNYLDHWDHIQFTKSQYCRNLYADLTIRLAVLNNINEMRQQLILIPNPLYADMLNNASSTLPIFNEIINECQVD